MKFLPLFRKNALDNSNVCSIIESEHVFDFKIRGISDMQENRSEKSRTGSGRNDPAQAGPARTGPPGTNLPIQLIASCSTLGDFTPLRFRYEDPEHRIQTVNIDRVLAEKTTVCGGVHCIQYTCAAAADGRERLFLIKYDVLRHTWMLVRMLS